MEEAIQLLDAAGILCQIEASPSTYSSKKELNSRKKRTRFYQCGSKTMRVTLSSSQEKPEELWTGAFMLLKTRLKAS